jgi:hypothetical protein
VIVLALAFAAVLHGITTAIASLTNTLVVEIKVDTVGFVRALLVVLTVSATLPLNVDLIVGLIRIRKNIVDNDVAIRLGKGSGMHKLLN